MFIDSEEEYTTVKTVGDMNKVKSILSKEDHAKVMMDDVISGAHYYSPDLSLLRLLKKHKFCSLDKFLDFINLYEYHKLHAVCNYESVVQNFTKLQIKAPFGFFMQFPDDFYVHVDSRKIKTTIEQFMDAVNYLHSLKAKEMNIKSNKDLKLLFICPVKEATAACNAALRKLSAICKSTDINYLAENGIYCRETFERKYGLTWHSKYEEHDFLGSLMCECCIDDM